MSSRLVVAIDGTAGSGKSTTARLVAVRLGLPHIDTGATYRLVAHEALQRGVPLTDGASLAGTAAEVARRCTVAQDGHLLFDGRPVGEEIRTPEVSAAASKVAAHEQVRRVLVDMQRALVPPHGAVVEGRDIGTVVWPTADVKVYLDAPEHVRAERRGMATGEDAASVSERDRRDATRPVGAMKPAADALVVDTGSRTPAEVADLIASRVFREPPRANPGYRVVRAVLSGLVRGPFRLEVHGAHNIPARGPAILAPNHRSLADIPVAGVLTKRKVWFMAKDELFRSQRTAGLLTRLGAFPVKRGRPDRKALQTALDLLRRGELVGLFPEGTRLPDARFDHVEDGIAYVALKSGAPVVPVALSGTEAIKPAGQRVPRLVRVRALVGEPVHLGGPVEGVLSRRRITEATQLAQERLRSVMDRLEPPR
ncbi:MAG TPA: (d)CMP kinase [Actinomycetota bacterium]|nr:(d)CMP kinase [Actinomycetota bacterium]